MSPSLLEVVVTGGSTKRIAWGDEGEAVMPELVYEHPRTGAARTGDESMAAGTGHRSRRNHFIPRLLLRGFASRVDGAKAWVYQALRGRTELMEVSTTDGGVERDFYGKTGDVEDELAFRENEHAPLVRRLRCREIDAADPPAIARFVSDLIIRTRNSRLGMAEFAAQMLDTFMRALETQAVRDRFQQDLMTVPTYRQTLTILKVLPPAFREAMLNSLDPTLAKAFRGDAADLMRWMLASAPPNLMLDSVRDAQIRALTEDRGARENNLRALQWTVESAPGGTFILGEVGVLARFGDEHVVHAPLRPQGAPVAFYLPLSSSSLLVGREESDNGYTPDAETLNIASAELSRSVFVSSTTSERERRYAVSIGARSALFSEEEVAQAMLQALGLVPGHSEK